MTMLKPMRLRKSYVDPDARRQPRRSTGAECNGIGAIAILSRPSRLAWYMARSAAATTSSIS